MNDLLSSLGIVLDQPEQPQKTKVKEITKKVKQKTSTQATLINLCDGIDLGEKESETKKRVKNVAKKVNEIDLASADPDKVLKSKKVSLKDKLAIIKENVLRVLGHQQKNVLVIRDLATFEDYVTKAIEAGRVAVDTETNNSTDPATCDIMGLCLYYPGGKQAYIPINHVDPDTGIRLEWQLTEEDCRVQLQRFVDAGTFIVMHNGKFDYEVIWETCGIKVPPNWDTIIGARLLDENEEAGLKKQYVSKIDPEQEKYDIEKLFIVPYKYVDPYIFALYAATDSLMTDKLYLYQVPIFEADERARIAEYNARGIYDMNEIRGLYWTFKNIEMPIVTITAEMELEGVSIDVDFGAKLKEKYMKQLDDIDFKIKAELNHLGSAISIWRLGVKPRLNARGNWEMAKASAQAVKKAEYQSVLKAKEELKEELEPHEITPERINARAQIKYSEMIYEEVDANGIKVYYLASNANVRMRTYEPKKSKKSREEIEKAYPILDKSTGKFYKIGKAPSEILPDEINLASPAQLAVLFYDVLGCDAPSKKAPRGTGEEELKTLAEKDPNLTICKLILKRRGIVKLITTYIDVIPSLAQHWPDRRIRFKLNSMGTDTGRYSSGGKFKFLEGDDAVEISGINIQNIPSHNPEIRMLFQAKCEHGSVQAADNEPFIVPEMTEIETVAGWKYCRDLVQGDFLIIDGAPVCYRGRAYSEATREYAILAY